jgi:DNA end-binding protein Ku
VAMYAATESASKTISMNQLHQKCGTPISQPKHCNQCNRDVQMAEIIKGYQFEKGRYVTFSDDELKAVKVESDHIVNLDTFVQPSDVGEIYHDNSYYLTPEGVGAKPFAMLRDVLKDGLVALGTLAIYGHEHRVVLKPCEKAMVLYTLHENVEVRKPDTLPNYDSIPASADQAHTALAKQLAQTMLGDFDPSVHEDSYRAEIRKMIEARVAGQTYAPTKVVTPKPVEDLTAALAASLASAGKKPGRPAKEAVKLEVPVVAKSTKRKKAVA